MADGCTITVSGVLPGWWWRHRVVRSLAWLGFTTRALRILDRQKILIQTGTRTVIATSGIRSRIDGDEIKIEATPAVRQ